jgi:phosphoserine phosphatase RsbU/P
MRVTFASLTGFLRQQSLYVALSAVVGAVFWAIGQRINPLTILLYSLSIGNLIVPITQRLHSTYASRRFPYNWIVFVCLLLLLLTPIYAVSSVVVWLIAPPTPQTLSHLLRTGWKFPFLVTFVFSTLIFLYRDTKDRLEKRNRDLQRTLELGTKQLELQEQEIQRAREIQQSLLPRSIPQLPRFEIDGVWQPANMVSGDYYDVLRLSDHRLGICIADVAGKGVSAALLMANVQAALRTYANDSVSPAAVCAKLNGLLHENLATGKFVTLLYGILDGESRTFRFCNAGHLDPILTSKGSDQVLDHGGAVLGVFPSWKYEDTEIALQSGDRLLLFTDGITEAEDSRGQEFEEESIAAFAKANATLSAKEMNNKLLERVTSFCGAHFRDDATLLTIAAT